MDHRDYPVELEIRAGTSPGTYDVTWHPVHPARFGERLAPVTTTLETDGQTTVLAFGDWISGLSGHMAIHLAPEAEFSSASGTAVIVTAFAVQEQRERFDGSSTYVHHRANTRQPQHLLTLACAPGFPGCS